MLPDSDNAPAGFAQRAVDEPVAGLIRSEFFCPKGAVVGRYVGVLRATVPEAAVHKNRDLQRGKNKIRPAKNRTVSPPARNAVLPEQLYQSELGFLVAASANARHHFGALRSGEDVRHGESDREVVRHEPRRCSHDFSSLHSDACLRGLVAVKLVVGEFADFKTAPRLRRERLEMFRPAAAGRGKAVGVKARVEKRERTPAANEFFFGQGVESLLESEAQVLLCRPAGRRDVDEIFHGFQATRGNSLCQDEIIEKCRRRFLRSGAPAAVERRCRPDDTVQCAVLQKSNCQETFAGARPRAR